MKFIYCLLLMLSVNAHANVVTQKILPAQVDSISYNLRVESYGFDYYHHEPMIWLGEVKLQLGATTYSFFYRARSSYDVRVWAENLAYSLFNFSVDKRDVEPAKTVYESRQNEFTHRDGYHSWHRHTDFKSETYVTSSVDFQPILVIQADAAHVVYSYRFMSE